MFQNIIINIAGIKVTESSCDTKVLVAGFLNDKPGNNSLFPINLHYLFTGENGPVGTVFNKLSHFFADHSHRQDMTTSLVIKINIIFSSFYLVDIRLKKL